MSICGVDRTIVSHRLVPASTSLDAQLAALTPGGVMAGGRRSAADPRAILGVRLPRAQRHVPEWRNWQTRGTQNPVGFTPRVGSIPSSGTMNKALGDTRPRRARAPFRGVCPELCLSQIASAHAGSGVRPPVTPRRGSGTRAWSISRETSFWIAYLADHGGDVVLLRPFARDGPDRAAKRAEDAGCVQMGA